MDFQAVLKEMVDRVNGGVAATIMANDGIPLQNYVKAGGTCDLESLGVEYGKVMVELKKAAEVLSLGGIEELVITSGGLKVVIRIVSPEYFAVFALTPEGNVGKAKYYLKRAAQNVAKELAA
ncbi:MAG: roadblock/LC7 domain-containing protein [Deltaproteobacteria bacterium]|nr:roadblock/LC7 domain-containing protein [Deltaproteobacteria bacterium]